MSVLQSISRRSFLGNTARAAALGTAIAAGAVGVTTKPASHAEAGEAQAASRSIATQASIYSEKQGNGIGVYISLGKEDLSNLERIKEIIAGKYDGNVPYQLFVSEAGEEQPDTVVALFIKGSLYGGKPYLLNRELLGAFRDSVPYYHKVKDLNVSSGSDSEISNNMSLDADRI